MTVPSMLAQQSTFGPTTSFATWAAAWMSAACGPDDVLAALQDWAPVNGILDDRESDFTDIFLELRKLTNPSVRLLLPIAGDVRGLTPGTDFEVAALRAGEAVVIGDQRNSLGFVPLRETPDVLQWNVFRFATSPLGADQSSLGDAELSLRDAIAEAAQTLAGLNNIGEGMNRVGTGGNQQRSDPRTQVRELVAHLDGHPLPPHTSARAQRVLTQVATVEAILLVAGARGPHVGITLRSAQTGDVTYSELWRTVRAARIAAVDAIARDALAHSIR